MNLYIFKLKLNACPLQISYQLPFYGDCERLLEDEEVVQCQVPRFKRNSLHPFEYSNTGFEYFEDEELGPNREMPSAPV